MTILGKLPPAASNSKAKTLCYDIVSRALSMLIRAFQCYSELWVSTKTLFYSQSTYKLYIQITITVLEQHVSLQSLIHSSAITVAIPPSRGK